MKLLPCTSAELESVFHNYGVNMRYLGTVAQQVFPHHMKLMCFVEMLARTAKNILFDQLSLLTKEQSTSLENPFSAEGFDKEMRVHLLDFLNLLFGESQESSIFWNEVLFVRAS
jgi:Translation initiation factor eIF3 subunit 135